VTPDASDRYVSLTRLSGTQVQALGVLAAGGTHEEAARAAGTGVHRVTISRWLRLHPGFMAAWNETRSEMHREMLQRLRVALNAASGAIADQIGKEADEGKVDTALHLLRRIDLGALLGSDRPGPVTPKAVIEAAAGERILASFDPFVMDRKDAVARTTESLAAELDEDAAD
jgi:hypothetical protein